MNPPGTFERVYATIKQRLREGAYKPGERLEPAALADELNASVTPVRDALHRLTGERLVEAPRHEGFRVPMLTETRLRHLYRWHLDLLLLALMKHGEEDLARDETAIGAASHQERRRAAFAALARAIDNPEHAVALRALGERLDAIGEIEELFLGDTATETAEIIDALRSNDRRKLRRSLLHYHRRRERLVPEIIARLQNAS
ncbi:MAG: GntR family transcriptional regulator [Bacillota bacterium]